MRNEEQECEGERDGDQPRRGTAYPAPQSVNASADM
jgi:hypothetical protein